MLFKKFNMHLASKLDNNLDANLLETTIEVLKTFPPLTIPFTVAGVFSTTEGKFSEGSAAFYALFNIKSTINYIAEYGINSSLEYSSATKALVLKVIAEQLRPE